jgi:hypothetical protein
MDHKLKLDKIKREQQQTKEEADEYDPRQAI